MEEALEGGNTTAGVVRVGGTVRRPRGGHSAYADRVLLELGAAGVTWAPRYLGVDDKGRDSFSFIDGVTTDHPSERAEASYAQMGEILRELHETTRSSSLAAGGECVVHGDPGPYNVVMVGGLPVALIDWDSARAGHPLEDFGYAGWTWCVQSVGGIPVADQARRLRALVGGYGVAFAPELVLAAVEREQTRIIDAETRILVGSPLDAGRTAHAEAAIEWAGGDRAQLRRHREAFAAALAE